MGLQPFFTTTNKIMAQRRIVKTSYNYTQGFSWASAECILDKPEIKSQIPLYMYYDTRRVLSFLLAWRQFPLFNGMSGHSGQWLAFGVDKMRSELGIRAERVRLPVYRQGKLSPAKWLEKENLSSLVLLERLGIVECHHLDKNTSAWPTYDELEQLRLDAAMLPAELGGGPDGYFHRHSFQTSSLFYRLADWLDLSDSDQPFNPFLLTFESGLKQAGSNLSHTLNGQSKPTQARPRSDSSLHGDSWSGKDGSKQQKPGLSEVAYSKAEGTHISEEPSFPDDLLLQAQPLYQLLRHAHYSLAGYNGSGMSEVKAVELANRWVGQELAFEQASAIVHRLTSDWNSARNNITLIAS